ncbi:MAG: NAD(P)H-hydrate dehydratase, partial [Dehalococcoidia bacterium]
AAGATRAGAGLVTLACARTVYPILAAKLVETTFLALPDEEGHLSAEAAYAVRQELEGYDALLVGCGLGQAGYVRAFMRSLLSTLEETGIKGLAIDADGLNNLAKANSGWEWWREPGVPAVVTPHPGEMARLTGRSVDEIQSDRLRAAQEAARRWGMAVALKGANTVVAAPDGRARISPFANPGLASAGTGDVLAGTVVGLMAQGLDPFDAASLAVFIHGLAAERLRRELGSAGMVAGDLLLALPKAMKELRGENSLGK